MILIERGDLAGSIHYKATKDSVELGSHMIYAAIHIEAGLAGGNRQVLLAP